MEINELVIQLGKWFDSRYAREIVRAFRQEPLVWRSFEDEGFLSSWVNYSAQDLTRWFPGRLAIFSLNPKLAENDLTDPSIPVPGNFLEKAELTLQTIQLTSLKPGALTEAANLSISLRQQRLIKGSWQGIWSWLSGPKQNPGLWHSTFALLPAILPQFTQFVKQLILESQSSDIPLIARFISHAIECQPIEEDQRYQELHNLLGDQPPDLQIQVLENLNKAENTSLVKLLARSFVNKARLSPQDSGTNFEAVSDLQKTARLNLLAGQSRQASHTIQCAFEALQLTQATLLHELVLDQEKSDPEAAQSTWQKLLKLAPDNTIYRREYAEFMASRNGQAIEDFPQNSEDTALLTLRYPALKDQAGIGESPLQWISKTQSNLTKSRFSNQSDQYLAAQLAFEQKQYPLAGELISRALEVDPNDLNTIKLSGQINQHLADVEKAIESASLVALFEPNNLANKKELASLYLQSQQPIKALEVYQELVSEDQHPDREDLLIFSEIAIKAGKPAIAIPIGENFLAHDELDGEALVVLCNAFIANNEQEKAIQRLEQASAVAPEKPSSWLALATIWTKLGRSDKALTSLNKARLALPENAQILFELGRLYLRNDQGTEAIAALRQSLSLNPDDVETRKLLTNAYYHHGYLDDAWGIIRPLEKDYTSDPDLALILGQVLSAIGDRAGARSALKFAWQSCNSEETLEAYARFLLNEKKIRKQLGKSDDHELQMLLNKLTANNLIQSKFELQLLAADMEMALGNLESAYKTYLTLLDAPEANAAPVYHHLQLQIGQVASALGMQDISLASLQEAILANPDDLEAYQILAEAYQTAGLTDEGLKAANSALQIDPSNLENLLWYSTFASSNQNTHEAIQVLKDAIHLRPDEKALYLALARTYTGIGYTDEAKNIMDKMLSLEHVSTEEYINVANLYMHLEDPEEATQIIRKAISTNANPDFEESRDLAYSVLSLGDAPAALKLIQELDANLRTQPCFTILKADVLTANKQFLPAYEALEPAVRQIEFATDGGIYDCGSPLAVNPDILPYSRVGVLCRAAQLQRIIGDLHGALKLTNLAQNLDPTDAVVQSLQANLAFSFANQTRLDSMLEQNNTDTLSPAVVKEAAELSLIQALATHNIEKLNLLNEHFFKASGYSSLLLSIKSVLYKITGNLNQAQTALQDASLELDRLTTRLQTAAYSPARHDLLIRQALATAIAAWDLEDYGLASKAFQISLSEIKVNPQVNKLLAEYLIDKTRASINASALAIRQHKPKPYSSEAAEEDLFQEQLSLAGRFINATDMLPALKIGQAVFSGVWNKADEADQIITNPRQATQILSIQPAPDVVKAIHSAYQESPEVLFQLAVIQLKSNPASSLKIGTNLLSLGQDFPALHAMLSFAAEGTDLQSAIKSMEKALYSWPDESDWHAVLGLYYEKTQDYRAAGKQLENALRIEPKNAEYWQMLGNIKVREKDYLAAKDYFAKAIELFPDNPEALESLAKINQQLGEHQVALQCLEKAARLAPENQTYKEAIAESHFAQNDYKFAIKAADEVLRSDPTNIPALNIKIRSFILTEQTAEAKRIVESARKLASDPLPFELLRIQIDENGDWSAGLAPSKMLAEQYPDRVEALNNLAEHQFQLNLFNDAQSSLHSSLELDPENPQTLLWLGKLARQQGNLDQALAWLTHALRNDPGSTETYLEIGQTYQERRETPKALETYQKAIQIAPKDPRPYINAANAYRESKDYRNAEIMLRQAVQILPNEPTIRRQLAAVVTLNLVNNLQEAPKRK